jgi:hypothetical protein
LVNWEQRFGVDYIKDEQASNEKLIGESFSNISLHSKERFGAKYMIG